MTTRFLGTGVVLLVILAGFSPLGAEKDSLTIEQAVEILTQQARSANSSRARLEIQMRLLSPEEQRQAEEFGELEYQLSGALDQLDKVKMFGTMDLQGGFIEATRLDGRQWKRQLARIDGIQEPGPAWQLRRVGELINSRQFFLDWQVGEREVLKPLRRIIIEQVNARLLVAIQIIQGVKRPEQEDGQLFPSPR